MSKSVYLKLYWVRAAIFCFDSARRKIEQLTEKLSASFLLFGSNKGFLILFLVGFSLSFAIAAHSLNSNNLPVPASDGNKAISVAQKQDVELTLASFSVTQAAYDRIIPKFVEKWKQEHDRNVVFKQNYGASGTQALFVIEGREEADVVHLSLAPDVHKIEKAGLIYPGWEKKFPNDSIVSKSVVAIVTREGNPKKIKTWSDLARNDVSVITPNPDTSGGGRWNFLALWNSGIRAGEDKAKTLKFVTQVYKNAPVLPESARQATDRFFKLGQGDALITYENEAILKASQGQKLPYIIPDVNFSIDNPVAIVDRNVDRHGNREVAEAFVQYLYSPEAQEEFAKIGYRPIDPNVIQVKGVTDRYPQVKTLATVTDFGGWNEIQKQFFDSGALFSQILKTINS